MRLPMGMDVSRIEPGPLPLRARRCDKTGSIQIAKQSKGTVRCAASKATPLPAQEHEVNSPLPENTRFDRIN